jgi:hypothetical protein
MDCFRKFDLPPAPSEREGVGLPALLSVIANPKGEAIQSKKTIITK